MSSQLEILLEQIKRLEEELVEELQKQEEEFFFEVRDRKRKVYFEDQVVALHKKKAKQLSRYFKDASWGNVISVPFIWSCFIPLLVLDVVVSLYQLVCFPLYGIPKVSREDYLIFDRRFLNYLNFLEKVNCAYCSYANGLVAYVQEIAARTEQYWCPIKHARKLKNLHSRYYHFLNYGDAEGYRRNIESVRRNFRDLRN